MLVPERQCKACAAVKKDKALLGRIYQSSFYVPGSKDSVKKVAKESGLKYLPLLNHVRKHQFIDSQAYQEAMLTQADKKLEKQAIEKAVRGQNVIQNIIAKGQARLDNEEITVNTDQLIRASQIQIQSDEKKKDQDLMAISLAHFISGESQNERIYVEPEIDYPG